MPKKLSLREQRRQARLKKVREASGEIPRIRVVPGRPELRSVLRHYPTGIAFNPEGSVEWPFDSFTKRRLRDGSIKREEAKPQTKSAHPPATKPAA